MLGLQGIAHAQTLPAPPVSPAPVVKYEYDAQGNLRRITQAPGVAGFDFKTNQGHDRLNRQRSTTDARLGVTDTALLGRDEPTSITDPRRLTTGYTRDGFGQVRELWSPDTGSATSTFDAAGNLLTRTDSRGVLATHTWDSLNRLQNITHTWGSQAALAFGYGYDQTGAGFSHGIGRLTSTTFPGGGTRYAHDPQGHVITATQSIAVVGGTPITLQVGYGYDGAGHITSIQYPSGRVLSIPHTGGLPASMSLATLATAGSTVPVLSQIVHEPFGAVRSWNWATAAGEQAHERVFDTSARAVRYPLGPYIRDLSYDAADRIVGYTHMDRTGVATAQAAALNQGFGYDELGRLTTSTGAWPAAYGYDANGNRTSAATPASAGQTRTHTIEPTSNRTTGLNNPTRSITFDAAGNTYTDNEPLPGWTAGYDMANRLAAIQVRKAGGVWECSNYMYDAFGQRVAKLWRTFAVRYTRDGCGTSGTPDTATIYVHDQQGQLLGEYRATDGAPLKEYLWLGSTPVGVVVYDTASAQSGELMHVHTDHLDTPRVIQDRAGRVRWTWLAEPFGNQAPNQDPQALGELTFNLRMPGQYFDREVGLFFNRARYYDSGLGRYVTSDPLGLAGGDLSLYTYVGGNPLSYVDPTGELRLPGDPTGLPPDWKRDPSHRDPNGERWRHPGGDYVDWHKGRPGMPGWRGKDHWHHNGGETHLPPGTEVADPVTPAPPASRDVCGQNCKRVLKSIRDAVTGAIVLTVVLVCSLS